MDFEIAVSYGNKPFTLKAKIEYHSNQIMRIRVHGKNNSILLENDYPLIQFMGSKKAIKWKLREGEFKGSDKQKDAQLLVDIMTRLENEIKGSKRYFTDTKGY